jgi:hypothetical protein
MKTLKSPRSLTTQINKHYSGGVDVVLMFHNNQYYLTSFKHLKIPALKGVIKMRINLISMWDTKDISDKIERTKLKFPLEVDIR